MELVFAGYLASKQDKEIKEVVTDRQQLCVKFRAEAIMLPHVVCCTYQLRLSSFPRIWYAGPRICLSLPLHDCNPEDLTLCCWQEELGSSSPAVLGGGTCQVPEA
jgi:hypothetical protein